MVGAETSHVYTCMYPWIVDGVIVILVNRLHSIWSLVFGLSLSTCDQSSNKILSYVLPCVLSRESSSLCLVSPVFYVLCSMFYLPCELRRLDVFS